MRVPATTEDAPSVGVLEGAQDELVRTAGATVVKFANREASHLLLQSDREVLERCMRTGEGAKEFLEYHLDAIIAAATSSNSELLQILLERDCHSLPWKAKPDALQKIIRANKSVNGADGKLFKITERFINYGADINGLDSQGNSALSSACTCGLPEVVDLLLHSGANTTLKHVSSTVNEYGVDTSGSDRPKIVGHKVDLLRVTLNALYVSAAIQNDPFVAYDKWGPIVVQLVNAGLTVSLDDPALTNFLHLAGYLGKLETVQKVLTTGTYSHAGRGVVGNCFQSLTEALHAATMNGHEEVVAYLLAFGASARAKCQHYSRAFRWDLPIGNLSAIAASCGASDDGRRVPTTSRPPAILNACELLLEAGVDEDDQYTFLEEAVRQGRTDIIGRCLSSGMHLKTAPLSRSLEAIQMLHYDGTSIDWYSFQKYSVYNRSVDMMKWFVDKGGPRLKSRSDFDPGIHELFPHGFTFDLADLYAKSPEEVLEQRRAAMIKYLIFEYGVSSPSRNEIQAVVYELILRNAILGPNVEVLDLLFHRENESMLSTLQQTSFTMLEESLLTNVQPGFLSAKDIQRLQTLLRISRGDVPLRKYDLEGLWLTPETLPSKLYNAMKEEPPKQSYRHRWQKPFSKAAQNIPLLSDKSHVKSTLSAEDSEGEISEDDQRENVQEVSVFITESVSASILNEKRYQYDNLERPYAIRVLELEASQESDAPIRCRLVRTDLSENPEYEALSYVWGSMTDAIDVSVNEATVCVGRNLWAALKRLRKTATSRRLWIDAICINQENVQEKNQQVSIMRHIYESAQRVVIWVGEADQDSRVIFGHLKLCKQYEDGWASGELRHRGSMWHEMNVINPPRYTCNGQTWRAWKRFCMRPWFYRTWVIQEFALSKQAIVMCGQDEEEWSRLIRPNVSNLDGNDSPTHVGHLREIRPTVRMQTILQYSSACGSSDPRDKVYGLLGVFSSRLINVDYTAPVEDVYTRFAQSALLLSRNLHLLHWFGTDRHIQTLRSWVPDLSISRIVGVLPRLRGYSQPGNTGNTSNEVKEMLGKVLEGFDVHGSGITVRGQLLERIHDISGQLIADPVNLPGCPIFTTIMHRWETLATHLQHKRFREPITAGFLRTLLAQDPHSPSMSDESNQGYVTSYVSWYERFGSGLLAKLDVEYFREMEVMLEWWGRRYQDDSMKNDIDSFTNEMKKFCYGRSFFITDKGSMGLAHPQASPGDSIVYFPGGLYPFILRPDDDGTHSLIGDCYLYDFDEYKRFTVENVKNFEAFVIA